METLKIILYAIFEITLVALVSVRSIEDVDNWRMHERRVGAFSCGPPQPRSLRLEEIMDIKELPDVSINVFPKMTVLHRCDSHSGCCASRAKACAPQSVENVTLTFRMIGNFARMENRKEKYLYVVATNHTRCSCQTAYDHPIK